MINKKQVEQEKYNKLLQENTNENYKQSNIAKLYNTCGHLTDLKL